MAEVFRATQPGFGGFEKTVAIKRMFSEYAHDERFVEMLADEAKIVSQLAHPNIVQILDIGRVHDDYYIAFEYIDGVDLFRLLQKHYELERDLPIAMVLYIIGELCAALDHAHARRTSDNRAMHIIHRDVSPQNVLLSYQGEVKLTDFGIAKAAYRLTKTQAGVVKGKLYYMSPEQARGEKLDHRSDLFSAGILLWELLCTRPLYDEDEQGPLLSAVGQAQYAWPLDKKKRVPAPLLALTEQALDRLPENRPQTGRAFCEALAKVAEATGERCDREAFGAYVRGIYEVVDDGPPQLRAVSKPAPFVERQSGEHWMSTVARVPTGEPDVDVPPPMPTDPAASPAATTAHGSQAAALASSLAADEDEPPPLDALLMPTTKPLAVHRHEQAAVMALKAPPLVVASAARPSPAAPPPDDSDEDEPTAMLDLSEIQQRLQGEAPPPIPGVPPGGEAPTVGMDVIKVATAPPPAEVAPPAKTSEASTRFVPAMQGDLAPLPHEGTTAKPGVGPSRSASRRLRAHTSSSSTEVPAWTEPGEEPASWTLLGLTAAIWAGVLVLGVYATLLVVSR